MGSALALIAIGVLIFLDRMGTGYGLREGWPWMIIALGIGGLVQNKKSLAAWITTIMESLSWGKILFHSYFDPGVIKTYFLPLLVIVIGLLWLWRYKKD